MKEQYNSRLNKIEALIDKWLPEKPSSSWFNNVFPYEFSVDEKLLNSLIHPAFDLVKRGGKRWRPLLMLLCAESLSGERGGELALPLIPLVELAHNASLIHDDLEDNSDERRGKPAVHVLYGMDTAINTGSFLYFLSLACLSDWESSLGEGLFYDIKDFPPLKLKDKIWKIWTSYMRALHLGQAMDIQWHRDFLSLPGLDEYERMCRLKTGCLASLASVIGIHCASAAMNPESRPDIDQLAFEFGRVSEELGVGFQILDDVKNLTVGVPGKKRGDDIVEGKKSLPVLLFLKRYPEKREFSASCFKAARANGTEAPEVEEFIKSLDSSGVINEARARGLDYLKQSKEAFSRLSIEKEGRELLMGLIDFLI